MRVFVLDSNKKPLNPPSGRQENCLIKQKQVCLNVIHLRLFLRRKNHYIQIIIFSLKVDSGSRTALYLL